MHPPAEFIGGTRRFLSKLIHFKREALNDAEDAVKRIAAKELSPEELLSHLLDLAADLEHQWKANVRPNSYEFCGRSRRIMTHCGMNRLGQFVCSRRSMRFI
jgi:hypothetical protein